METWFWRTHWSYNSTLQFVKNVISLELLNWNTARFWYRQFLCLFNWADIDIDMLSKTLCINHICCTCAFSMFQFQLSGLFNIIWAHRNNLLRQRLGRLLVVWIEINFFLGIFSEWGDRKQQQAEQKLTKNVCPAE